ncbi:MAG: diguanylate cyclase [Betaproteobacteria bacterium]|nr:diguanylate cyclase [Betaproteobacteria bacterium]
MLDQVHPQDLPRAESGLRAHFERRAPYDVEIRFRRKDGGYVWVRAIGQGAWDALGTLVRFSGSITDISERRDAEEKTAELLSELRAVFSSAPVGIALLRDRRIVHSNAELARALGYSVDEVIGLSTRAFFRPDDDYEEHGRRIYARLAGGEFWQSEKELLRKDGSRFFASSRLSALDPAAPHSGAVWVVQDISEQRNANEKLLQLAHYDQLTQLPNRVLFLDRLQSALSQAQRNGWNAGVMLIDLDRFKLVNDTLGHHAGDAVLAEIGRRIQAAIRGSDTVARLSGDEFGVILSDLAAPEAAGAVAEKIGLALKAPISLARSELIVSASIGISVFPPDGAAANTILGNADVALYRAKQSGRDAYCFHTPEMSLKARRRAALEERLRRALARGQFRLYYQPKVELSSGRILGVEAPLLELEITESVIMEDAEGVIPTLQDLQRLGVEISLDDFGTGYSSLGYLNRFQVDRLKIDRTFVSDLGGARNDGAILKAVIALGHQLGMKVLAEGVETEEQRGFLAAHGCDEYQGYLFSKPLPADAMLALWRSVDGTTSRSGSSSFASRFFTEKTSRGAMTTPQQYDTAASNQRV